MSFKKNLPFLILFGALLFWTWSCGSKNNPASSPAPVTIYYIPGTATFTPTLTPGSPTITPTRGHPLSTGTPTPTPTGSATPTITFTPLAGATAAATLFTGDFKCPWGVAFGTEGSGVSFIAVSDTCSTPNDVQVFRIGSSGTTYLYSIPATTPQGLAIDSYGELYIAEYEEVEGYYLNPGAATTYTYDYTWSGQGQVNDPVGIKIDANGNLVVSDNTSGIIYNLSWNDDSILNQTTGGPAIYPNDLALDSNGNIYTAAGNEVVEYDNNYGYFNSFSGSGWTTSLSYAISVGVDSKGNLYISDNNNSKVDYATASGAYLGGITGLGSPAFLALGNANALFVADNGNKVVYEYHGF